MPCSHEQCRVATEVDEINVREGHYAQSKIDFISKMNIALKEAGEVMEQREQSEACFDFAESRQNSTIVKPTTGLT